MLFEYLGELFSLPESELKRLFWETVVARTPKVPPFDRLFFATQFFYRDPKKVSCSVKCSSNCEAKSALHLHIP